MKSIKSGAVCPICHKGALKTYRKSVNSVYSQHPYDLMYCTDCDHYFTFPFPTKKELDHIYKNNYAYDAHLLIHPEKKYRAKKYADLLAKSGKNLSVLEIGCMHGFLLQGLKEHGFKCEGIELDKDAVEFCNDHGLDVQQGTLENLTSKSTKKYDMIIMSHVLEHILDPDEQLQLLKKHLRPGGKIVLILPNASSATRKAMGRYWGYWQVPVHINHFTKKSLPKLLKKHGYKVQRISTHGADSLFFLSSAANLVGDKSTKSKLGLAKKALVKTSSVVLRPWTAIGSEDLIVIAEKK